jgi:nicotinamidase-related amidase
MKYVGDHAIVRSHAEVVDIWNRSTPAATVVVAPGSTGPAAITYQGRQIPNSFDEIVNPKHTVLLVHEMLNDFISPGGGYDKAGRRYDPARMATIVPPIQKLLAAARAKKVRVVYVRYTSLPDGVTSSDPDLQRSANSTRPGATGPLTVDGTWGWEVVDDVKPAAGDVVLRKYRPDAFFGTILEQVLRWNNIKTVVMVGIGGEVGVVPTLMHAENLGLFTVAIQDGILSSNPARMEDAMRFITDHATVKPHQEVLAAWDKYPAQSASGAGKQ